MGPRAAPCIHTDEMGTAKVTFKNARINQKVFLEASHTRNIKRFEKSWKKAKIIVITEILQQSTKDESMTESRSHPLGNSSCFPGFDEGQLKIVTMNTGVRHTFFGEGGLVVSAKQKQCSAPENAT